MPKTNAEMCRQYRRKKNENKIKMKKNPGKSSTERSREFRARKKQLLNNQNRCSNISINVTDVINDHSQQQNSVPTGYNLVNNDLNIGNKFSRSTMAPQESTISYYKNENFLKKLENSKSVAIIPGVGVTLATKLAAINIIQPLDLYNKLKELDYNKHKFRMWLNKVMGSGFSHVSTIYDVLLAYRDQVDCNITDSSDSKEGNIGNKCSKSTMAPQNSTCLYYKKEEFLKEPMDGKTANYIPGVGETLLTQLYKVCNIIQAVDLYNKLKELDFNEHKFRMWLNEVKGSGVSHAPKIYEALLAYRDRFDRNITEESDLDRVDAPTVEPIVKSEANPSAVLKRPSTLSIDSFSAIPVKREQSPDDESTHEEISNCNNQLHTEIIIKNEQDSTPDEVTSPEHPQGCEDSFSQLSMIKTEQDSTPDEGTNHKLIQEYKDAFLKKIARLPPIVRGEAWRNALTSLEKYEDNSTL